MNILILCTGNSARSILAEAIFNQLGKGRIHAFSAGSKPTGTANPYALNLLKEKGYAIEHYRSKSWDEFAKADAPKMDVVITVCNNAANETCPIWPGAPITLHWPFSDPATATGSNKDIAAAFDSVYQQIYDKAADYINTLFSEAS